MDLIEKSDKATFFIYGFGLFLIVAITLTDYSPETLYSGEVLGASTQGTPRLLETLYRLLDTVR